MIAAMSLLESPRAFALMNRLLGGRRAHRALIAWLDPPGLDWQARVLDLGCGVGALLNVLPHDVHYLGIDQDAAYIERARRWYPDRDFRCADVTTVDLSDQPPFDAVVVSALLHHLDDAGIAALCRLVRRVTRPRARLVAIDPDLAAPGMAGWAVRADRGMHIRSAERYQRLLQALGPTDVQRRTDLLRIPYAHILLRVTLA